MEQRMQCEFKYCRPVVWISRGTEMERPSSSLLGGVISVGNREKADGVVETGMEA